MNKSQIFWGAYKNLEESVIEVSKFIYITDEKIVNGIRFRIDIGFRFDIEYVKLGFDMKLDVGLT